MADYDDSGKIAPVDGEIAHAEESSAIEATEDSGFYEVVVDLTSENRHAAEDFTAQIAEFVRIGDDVVDLVDPAKEYVLRIPDWFTGDSKDAWLMRSRNDPNAIRANIMHYNKSGKPVVLEGLEAVERPAEQFVDAAGRDLANALNDVAVRQQLAECAQELRLLNGKVEEVVKGQMDDRRSMIDGALNQVKAALESGDREYIEKQIAEVRPFLNIGAEQVRKAIERQASAFKEIPNNELAVKFKVFMEPNWIYKLNDTFDELQDCLEYVAKAYAFLAAAAIEDGHPETASAVLEPLRELLSGQTPKLVRRFVHLHPDIDFSHEWFCNPKRYLEVIKSDVSALGAKSGERCFLIKVPGSMLLNEANDDTNE